MAQLLLRPTEETVKNAFYGRPLVGVSPPPTLPFAYFHILSNYTYEMRGALRRTVEATPTAPPTVFFPCNLCAYLWPDICLPAAIYGGRDNSNKGGCHPGGDWHWCAPTSPRTGSDIWDKAKLFKTFQNKFGTKQNFSKLFKTSSGQSKTFQNLPSSL